MYLNSNILMMIYSNQNQTPIYIYIYIYIYEFDNKIIINCVENISNEGPNNNDINKEELNLNDTNDNIVKSLIFLFLVNNLTKMIESSYNKSRKLKKFFSYQSQYIFVVIVLVMYTPFKQGNFKRKSTTLYTWLQGIDETFNKYFQTHVVD